jgi:hypothetical protein
MYKFLKADDPFTEMRDFK